jgi:hypothetical protein
MELVHRRIPREFLESLPDGFEFIHRNGKEFLVVAELGCPAGHSLMAPHVRIHDQPSIKIQLARPAGRGTVFIDAFWGSHAKLFDFLPDPGEDLRFAEACCPACGVSLMATLACERPGCGSAAAIVLRLPGSGNLIQVCARLGCPEHRLVLGGVARDLTRAVSAINFFGHGEEEQFGGI